MNHRRWRSWILTVLASALVLFHAVSTGTAGPIVFGVIACGCALASLENDRARVSCWLLILACWIAQMQSFSDVLPMLIGLALAALLLPAGLIWLLARLGSTEPSGEDAISH